MDNIIDDIIDDQDNRLPLTEVFLGFSTSQKFKQLYREEDISDTQFNSVPLAAADFYKESLRYIINKMDMSSSFWQQAVWIDFFNRKDMVGCGVLYREV